MFKGQLEAISLVLIAGIVLSLAGAAYVWVMPTIEKRTTATDIATAESFMKQLSNAIITAANTENYAQSFTVPVGGTISVNTSDNRTIIFRFTTGQPMIQTGEGSVPVPIDSVNLEPVGSQGESPRYITLEGENIGDHYLMTMKMFLRELTTDTPPEKGYVIMLVPEAQTGSRQISVSHGSTEIDEDMADNGGDLVKTMVKVTIS